MNRKILINFILVLALLGSSTSNLFAYRDRNRQSGWGRQRHPRRMQRRRGQSNMFSPFGGTPFRQPVRSSHKFTGIEREIENLFSNTVKPIADELKNVKAGKPAQQAIEKKVKEREQRFQQAQRQRAQQSRYRRPSRSRYRSPYSRPFGRSPFGRSRYRSPHSSWRPGRRWSPGGFGGGSSPWRNTKSFSPSTWKPDDTKRASSTPNTRGGFVNKNETAPKAPTTNGKGYTPSLSSPKNTSTALVRAGNLRNNIIQTMQDSIKKLKHPQADQEDDADKKPGPNFQRDLIGQFGTLATQIQQFKSALNGLKPQQQTVELNILKPIYEKYFKWFAQGFWAFNQRQFDESVRGCKLIFKELYTVLGEKYIKRTINNELTQYLEKQSKATAQAIKDLDEKTKAADELKTIGNDWWKRVLDLKAIRSVFPFDDDRLAAIIEGQEEEKDRLLAEKKIEFAK